MKLGKVIGTVVASRKVESYNNVKLNVVQPLNEDLEPIDEPLIAADAIKQANRGEIVFYVTSRDAPQAFESEEIPVDAAIVGIVDIVSKS